jgi:hypothetical protein
MEIEDAGRAEERLAYSGSGAPTPFAGPFRLTRESHVVALADGEGLYLLAWTYGAKLYRLRADFSQLWSAQIMPVNVGMAFYFEPEERLALDEQGRVHVAYQIFEDDVAIYNRHFQRPAVAPIGAYDVLVERFDADGSFSGARIFGTPELDAPCGMTVRSGEVLLGGSSRVKKSTLPNRTLEWDLFVLRGHIEDGPPAVSQTIDLSRDDFAWEMQQTPDGTVQFGGRTDYVQVDTNSEVEDGKGLLLALSASKSITTLPGPRDVQVRSFRSLPDGRVAMAGERNGPLTHTDPSMTFNEGFLGVASIAGQ